MSRDELQSTCKCGYFWKGILRKGCSILLFPSRLFSYRKIEEEMTEEEVESKAVEIEEILSLWQRKYFSIDSKTAADIRKPQCLHK